jgi:hypothetical protein
VGYIVLAKQLKTINELTNDRPVDSLDLLWMPGHLQLTVWDNVGNYTIHRINEDGQVEDEST